MVMEEIMVFGCNTIQPCSGFILLIVIIGNQDGLNVTQLHPLFTINGTNLHSFTIERPENL